MSPKLQRRWDRGPHTSGSSRGGPLGPAGLQTTPCPRDPQTCEAAYRDLEKQAKSMTTRRTTVVAAVGHLDRWARLNQSSALARRRPRPRTQRWGHPPVRAPPTLWAVPRSVLAPLRVAEELGRPPLAQQPRGPNLRREGRCPQVGGDPATALARDARGTDSAVRAVTAAQSTASPSRDGAPCSLQERSASGGERESRLEAAHLAHLVPRGPLSNAACRLLTVSPRVALRGT